MRLHGAMSQTAVIFMIAALSSSSLANESVTVNILAQVKTLLKDVLLFICSELNGRLYCFILNSRF